MKKTLALLLAVLMLVAAFAGCGEKKTNDPTGNQGNPGTNDPDQSASNEPYGVFRTYMVESPTTLNRFIASDTGGDTISGFTSLSMYSGKVNDAKDGWEWVCAGAADWPKKMDEEGKVWQVTIRDNCTWSNGDKITVDDYIYTYQMLLDPIQQNSGATSVTNNSYFSCVNVSKYQAGECFWEDVGIKKINDYTMEFTGVNGVPEVNIIRFCNVLTLVHKPTYEKGMNESRTASLWGTDLDNYMSCGSFILTEWIKDGKFVLKRNPNYVLADVIKIEGMEYSIVPNAGTALQLFKNGDLDYCSIGFADWEEFEDDPRIYEYFGDSLMYYMVNLGNPNQGGLLGNLDFRKALNHAADRNEIADIIGAYPATRLVRRAVQADETKGVAFVSLPQDYVPDAGELFDVAKANEYIDKAFAACGLKNAKMEILLNEDSTHIKSVTEIIHQQYTKAFGDKLKVTIRGMPANQSYTMRRWNPDDPDSFDTAFGSFLPSVTDCRETFKFYYSKRSPMNVYHINPEYDAMYEKSLTLDIREQNDEVVKICMEMEKYLIENLIIIPMYEIPQKVLYSEKITLPGDGYIIGFGFGNAYMTISK